MLDKTDLSQCKKIAKCFLDIEIQTNNVVPDIISHPFFQSCFVIDETTGDIVNILEDGSALNKKKEQISKKIDKIENFMQFTILITNPYRLAFLKYTSEYLNNEDFSRFLIDTWVSDEYVNLNKDVSKKELVSYFKRASKEFIMEEDEMQEYTNMEDEVVIYRGVTDYNNKQIKAMSWTLSQETAEWFANRFNQCGYVYRAKIKKKDILAYCNQREEKEIIVDYNKLYDIELIK